MASIKWPWSRKDETRASGGFTSEIIAARQRFFSGADVVAETTAVVESCASLWERAFSVADVPDRWRSIVSPSRLALIGRSLATRGQYVALIDARGPEIVLTPAVDWDVSTRGGEPVAYRLQIPEAGGGDQVNALADEVVDIRINVDPVTPWHGTSPLRKARLTAELLASIESGLGDVLQSPWGAQVLPLPDIGPEIFDKVKNAFAEPRQKNGGLVFLPTSHVLAKLSDRGTPGDYDTKNLTPDVRGLELPGQWEAVRNSILAAYGIPPILFSAMAQSAALREGQRHAVLWSLAPIAKVASAELAGKLDDPELRLDLTTPLAAADSAGRARAVGILVGNGMPMAEALELVGWTEA